MMRIALLLVSVLAFSSSALPQAYPTRAVTLVVPAAPGGPTDALARVLSEKLQERLKQPVIVENRGGANGTIGVSAVVRAPADGHTILISVDGPVLVSPTLSSKLPYDSLADLQPLAVVGDGGDVVLAVPVDSPAKTVVELVELMRKDPSRNNYVSSGAGFPSHIVAEMLKREGQFEAQHIPVRGAGSAMKELLSGRMSFSFPPVSLASAHAKGNKIRLIAIASRQRNGQIPNVPTFTEAGFPNVSPPGYWIATYVRSRTPPEVVELLSREIRDITNAKDYEPLLLRQGLVASKLSPSDIAIRMRTELEFWRATNATLGISVD